MRPGLDSTRLSGALSLKAQRHLESLGVEVFTNARVTHVDSDGIVVGNRKFRPAPFSGELVSLRLPAGRWLGVETDKSGKIMVGPDLSVRDHPEVFAIGDTAHVIAPVRNLLGIKSKTPMIMPGVAQPAIQEGEYVGKVIRRRVTDQPKPQPFWYWDKGDSQSSAARMQSPTCGSHSSRAFPHGSSGRSCIFTFSLDLPIGSSCDCNGGLISSRNVVEYESYPGSRSQRRNPSIPQLEAGQTQTKSDDA